MRQSIRWGAVLAVLALAGQARLPEAAAQGQNAGTIRGRVVDGATQRPLASVQVFIAASGQGVLTNVNGDYVLPNVNPGQITLSVQLVGYANRSQQVTVTAGASATANFDMSQTAIPLDEIVVTGTPGAAAKRTVPNAVSTVRASEITDKIPVATVDQLLTGRTPGLTFMAGAGTLGTASNIRIRGAGSVNAENAPVFYVDGVRFSSNQRGTYGVSGQSRNPLDALNPDDIESIEVIKGPAASTLYGAEAANGVIQIITKKGLKGQPNISWSARADMGNIDWFLNHPTNYKLCNAVDIRTPATWPGCAQMDSLAPGSQRLLSNNPVEDTPGALREGSTRRYGLSARGGGERYSFYASYDREDESGVFINNELLRNSGRVNFQAVVLDNLDVTFSTGYTRLWTRLPQNDNASNGLLRNAYRGRPGRVDPWQTGFLGLGPNQLNTYYNVHEAERFLTSTTMNYRPAGWLTSRLTVGLDLNSGLAETFTPIDTTGRQPFGATAALGQAQRTTARDYQWTADFAATAQHKLGAELSSALSLGGQMNMNRYRALNATGRGFISNNVNLIGAAAITTSGENQSEQNSVGFYAEEKIGWKDRRYITAAVRVDDNSAFGEDFTLAVYPKAGVSWIISEEPFFTLGAFDELRLRGAFGRAGNAPDPFSADKNYETTSTTFNDGSTQVALQPNDFGNPELKAETGHEFELGADAGLFSGRAGVELTYYNQRTKDALINVPVAPSSGFTGNQLQNVGEILNSGLELAIWGNPVHGRNLTWQLRGTLATNHNEVISLGGRPPIKSGSGADVHQHRVGYPLAGYWYTTTLRGADGRPILDAQNRARITPDTLFLGPSAPTRELGLTSTLTLFGGLSFYVFADYKGGHYMWNLTEYTRTRSDQNDVRVNDPDFDPLEREALINGGNRPFFDNADFIKLREVSVSYQVPQRFLQHVRAKGATLSLSGRNLGILWTKYDLGAHGDPEVNFSGDATFNRVDYMSVPMLRRYTASVAFTF